MALFNNQQFIALGVAGALVIWLASRKAAQVANAVNPMNPENVINRGAEAVFTQVTGSEQAPGAALYGVLKGGRDEWTMARTDQIIWERRDAGLPLDPLMAMGQARYEWNRDHAKWWKVGDSWSKAELNGYQP